MQLFKGILIYRCYDPSSLLASTGYDSLSSLPPAALDMVPPSIDMVNADEPDKGICTINTDGGPILSIGTVTCEDEGQVCRYYGGNPSGGSVSFDNIGLALMTIFQCVTLEGWTDVMYACIKTAGALSSLYFISLILIGAYYVLNLFLAVLWDTYTESIENEKVAAEAEAAMAFSQAAAKAQEEALKAAADIKAGKLPPVDLSKHYKVSSSSSSLPITTHHHHHSPPTHHHSHHHHHPPTHPPTSSLHTASRGGG